MDRYVIKQILKTCLSWNLDDEYMGVYDTILPAFQ